MDYFSGCSNPSLWSGSLISFHCLRRNPADSDHFCCVSVWRGTRSATVIGCRDSAKLPMLRALLALQPWQSCSAQVLLLAWQNATQYADPLRDAWTWWYWVTNASLLRGLPKRLVGEVSGVVQLARQSKLTSTWLLQTSSQLSPATIRCVNRAYTMPEF